MLVLVRVSCSNGSACNPGGIAIHEDKHKAPTHLRIRPLSLQNAGDARVPMGVITLFDWKNSLGYRFCKVTGQIYHEMAVDSTQRKALLSSKTSYDFTSSHSMIVPTN